MSPLIALRWAIGKPLLLQVLQHHGLSEADFDAECERIMELRDLSAETPARTLESARGMLRMALTADYDQDFSGAMALARNALATLDRLAGRA